MIFGGNAGDGADGRISVSFGFISDVLPEPFVGPTGVPPDFYAGRDFDVAGA